MGTDTDGCETKCTKIRAGADALEDVTGCTEG